MPLTNNPNPWILVCKEAGPNNTEGSGNIYVARLPVGVNADTPGIPDGYPAEWQFVGPGNNPSISAYQTTDNTQFILTFSYLSHMFCRVFDLSPGNVPTWPPSVVNPIQTSGTRPNPVTFSIQDCQDALSLGLSGGGSSFAQVGAYFNPVVLLQPLLFLDPSTDTYSVTIEPAPGWGPQVGFNSNVPPSPSQPTYFRVYARPYPYTAPYTLVMDWRLASTWNPGFPGSYTYPAFSFVFSSVGSLRYQFSAIWGAGINPVDPQNPNDHQGGIIGFYPTLIVDSTTQHPSYQEFPMESLVLDENSSATFGFYGPMQQFIMLNPTSPEAAALGLRGDIIELSKSLLESGNGSTFAVYGPRSAFLNKTVSDTLDGFTKSGAPNQGSSFGFFDVRV
jgi:hypothetical protein